MSIEKIEKITDDTFETMMDLWWSIGFNMDSEDAFAKINEDEESCDEYEFDEEDDDIWAIIAQAQMEEANAIYMMMTMGPDSTFGKKMQRNAARRTDRKHKLVKRMRWSGIPNFNSMFFVADMSTGHLQFAANADNFDYLCENGSNNHCRFNYKRLDSKQRRAKNRKYIKKCMMDMD